MRCPVAASLVLLLYAYLAIPAGAQQLQTGQRIDQPVLLFDFETEDQMANWSMLGAGEVEWSDERACSGKRSAKVALRKWQEGDARGPDDEAFGNLSKWSFAKLSYPPGMSDWSFFGGWRARIYRVGEATVYHEMFDEQGTKWWRPIRLESDRWVTVEFPFTGGVDLGRISHQWFFRSEKDPEAVIYIDDVELVLPGASWLDQYARRLPDLPQGSSEGRAVRETVREIEQLISRGRASYEGDEPLSLPQAAQMRAKMDALVVEVHCQARSRLASDMASAARQQAPAANFGVGVLSSMQRPYVRDLWFPARARTAYHLRMAQRDYESFQVIVASPDVNLQNVQVQAAEFVGPDGAVIGTDQISVRVVGSFLTGRPSDYVVDYAGWHADVLLPGGPVDIPAGDFQAFWVTVASKPDQKPGVYRGRLKVQADTEPDVWVEVSLTVWDFALPDRPSIKTAMAFHEGYVKSVYGRQDRELLGRFAAFLADYGLSYTENNRARPLDVELLKQSRELTGPRSFSLWYVNSWLLTLTRERQKPHADFILSQLRKLVPELEREGLIQGAFLYAFDEARMSGDMVEILKPIREHFPDLPVLTTAHDPSYGTDSILADYADIFVPGTHAYDPAQAEKARAAGKEVWWYFCISQRHPHTNWFLEYPLIETRLLFGPLTALYRPDGVLYWSLNVWDKQSGFDKPLTGGPLFPDVSPGWKGNHGDGIAIYPGPDGPLASVRLEAMRDGMQDYEAYVLLRKLLHDAQTRGMNPESPVLERAERAARVNPEVAASKVEYSLDAELYSRERARVADAIAGLKRALAR